MSVAKEKQYQKEFAPHLKLIDGLAELLNTYHKQGIKMAIGSAAIMFNIDFVLDGLQIRHYFDAIVSADDVVRSKPDPETYLKCATLLSIAPAECLVFEDAPKGVDAALNANMDCVVLTTMHNKDEFNQRNIISFHKDFTDFAM
ncbi:HAD family phosphatase [Niabella ginsengisoli]|uniref:HAD family phosphatase n=1 Tax=Niabella ginsengisoli TaxID=522298 RepID=A0ABS9SJR7_9BACT|nr:HAD family phosphatase [Niabella ginsengisoli]